MAVCNVEVLKSESKSLIAGDQFYFVPEVVELFISQRHWNGKLLTSLHSIKQDAEDGIDISKNGSRVCLNKGMAKYLIVSREDKK